VLYDRLKRVVRSSSGTRLSVSRQCQYHNVWYERMRSGDITATEKELLILPNYHDGGYHPQILALIATCG
jgi:hypothetical protein